MNLKNEDISGYRVNETKLESLTNETRQRLLSEMEGSVVAKTPMLYLDRRLITTLLTKIKMYEKIIDVQGSIVECGVHKGGGVMTYYHLSSILEPYALNRKIIGFDTFCGFPSVSSNDSEGIPLGYFNGVELAHIKEWIDIQDRNRPLGHLPKVELIVGDACHTIPKYVADNPQTIISLLYLDFDLYEPTKVALENLVPLVPKGGIVGFDEINRSKWSGETQAFKEVLGVSNTRLKRFYFDAHVSYYIVE